MTPSGARQRIHLANLLEEIRRLPSILGQLAYLAGLRDPNTGTYSHQAIREHELRCQADRELRRLHETAFRHWLNMPLKDQSANFDLHISGIQCDKAIVVGTWKSCETYRAFIPASASHAERYLFLSDMEMALDLVAGLKEKARGGIKLLGKRDEWLSVRQLTERIGVSARTLRLWAEQGVIPAIKIGRQWRFHQSDADEWVDTKLSALDNRNI